MQKVWADVREDHSDFSIALWKQQWGFIHLLLVVKGASLLLCTSLQMHHASQATATISQLGKGSLRFVLLHDTKIISAADLRSTKLRGPRRDLTGTRDDPMQAQIVSVEWYTACMRNIQELSGYSSAFVR